MQLPQGYDTVLYEDGGNISKGQKQLLRRRQGGVDLPGDVGDLVDRAGELPGVEDKGGDLVPVSFFDRNQAGDIISRVSYDVDVVGTCISADLSQILTSLVTVAGSFVMMAVISPVLTAVTLVTIPMAIGYTTAEEPRQQASMAQAHRYTRPKSTRPFRPRGTA